MRKLVAGVILSAMVLSGCQRGGGLETKEAVQKAVEAHLKGNAQLELSNFTTSVQSVKFTGDSADALVQFQGKDMPDAKVLVRYQLKKAGEHWEVTSSAPAGGQGMNGHGQMPQSPALANPAPNQGAIAPQASH